MTETGHPGTAPAGVGPGWAARLAGQGWFHRICARLPGLRSIARAEGDALFEVVSGFVRSQTLLALVELRVLHRLADGALSTADLARATGVPEARMLVLARAGAGLRLMKNRKGLWQLTTRGAAFLVVPGLEGMVRHHPVLYRDLGDPVSFFRGGTDPDLARFWPYVFGGADEATATRYSRLMAESQALVAEDTLRIVSFSGIRHLMDVGGGTGAFLSAVAAAHPSLQLTLFDLPEVVASAHLTGVRIIPGSFREDALPRGADAIGLIRVLYDHADATVAALLRACHAALPDGGRLIISEPMSGGDRPDPATDVYFAIYTMAMQTGRTRSGSEIAALAKAAGFSLASPAKTLRPFVTSALVLQR
jgi:demethylspheroidene O-methyltransferase